MVIRKLNELSYQRELPLQGSYTEFTANYISVKKDIETFKKNQEEMKNTTYELNNTVERIKSRLDEAEHQIIGLEEKVEKTQEKELSDKEMAYLSDAEFKTLVVRMLTELVEYGHKMVFTEEK